jgi:phosphotransferase system  glucose/maltose/N-acetylglucosamine-specific IIC component
MLPGPVLAYAESTDPTVSNLSTVLACAAIVLVAGMFALIPILIAWSRRHRHSQAIFAIAMLWGMLVSISGGSTVLAQMKYSHEHLHKIESGYVDPQDISDAPKLPWLTWAGLAMGYGILIGWPLLGKTLAPLPNPPDEPS